MCGCGKLAMCGCVLLLALLAVPGVDGQFLSVSSSSVSWVLGDDGQLHEETHSSQHEASLELGNDGQLHKVTHEIQTDKGMLRGSLMQQSRAEVVCIDGECKERDTITLTNGAPPHSPHPCGGGPPMMVLLLPGSGPERNFVRQVEAPPSIVPRPGPAEMDVNANAVTIGAFLAVMALVASTLTLFSIMCQSSRTVEAREPSLTQGPLAEPLALSQDVPMSVLPPAVAKPEEKPEDCGCGKEPAQEPVDCGCGKATFHFQPSVGTWLCHRVDLDEE